MAYGSTGRMPGEGEESARGEAGGGVSGDG